MHGRPWAESNAVLGFQIVSIATSDDVKVDEPVSKSGRGNDKRKGVMLPPPPRQPVPDKNENTSEITEKTPQESGAKEVSPIGATAMHDLDDHFIPPDDKTIRYDY